MANKTKKAIFNHKGTIYFGSIKSNKITVRVERTAQGQNSIVGTYDIIKKEWSNAQRLPIIARQHFEENFS